MSAHLLAQAEAIGRAARICRSIAESLSGDQATGAERCYFSIHAEVARILGRLGKPGSQAGHEPDRSVLLLEREAVMRVVQRHVQTSHFVRIRAAVDSDAKSRGSA